MKTRILPLVAGLLVASTRLAFSADAINETLQKGLLEEEANHNLDAAIQAYQSVVNQHDDQRKIVATAVFRLAECYRKQGKTNEAAVQYQRVVQDFADQSSLVGPSEKNLASLGRGSSQGEGRQVSIAAQTVTDPEQLKLLKNEIDLVEQEIKTADAKFRNGKGDFADIVRARKELLSLQRRLPENASVAAQKNLLNQQVQLMEQLLREVKKQIEVGVKAPGDEIPLQRELLGLQRELIAISKGVSTARAPADAESAASTDEETKEIQRLREILRNSPDLINAKDNNSDTPLHKAASSGRLAVARFLLESKAAVNARDRSGQTALHLAAVQGHKAMADLLLKHGAEVDAKSHFGKAPLHNAAEYGYQAVAEVLLAHGADVGARNSSGQTPLHSAAESGYAGMVQLLLKNKAEIDAKDNESNTPLNAAVKKGKSDVAKLLLEKGADANVQGSFGDTPLHSAVMTFSDELFKAMLARKPKLELENNDEMTPLQMAVYHQNERAAELLLKAGANPNVKFDWKGKKFIRDRTQSPLGPGQQTGVDLSGEGRTPLHLAVELDNKGIVEALLSYNADVNAQDDYGATPLHRAIWQWNKGIVEALLAKKADVNAKSLDGNTPLHAAVGAGSGDKAIVELLLARGADVNARNKENKTPLDLLTKSSPPPGFPAATGTIPGRRAPNIRTIPARNLRDGVTGVAPAPIERGSPASPGEIADILRKHGAKE